jgi:hypothetical protein
MKLSRHIHRHASRPVHHHLARGLFIGASVVVAVVAVVSLCLNNNQRTLEPTLCGLNVRHQTTAAVTPLINELTDKIRFNVTMDGQTVTATPADLGITIDIDATIAQSVTLDNQRTFIDYLNPFPSCELGLVSSYSPSSIEKFLATTFPDAKLTYREPSIQYSYDDLSYHLITGSTGDYYDLHSITTTIDDALAHPRAIDLNIHLSQTTPRISNDTAEQTTRWLNQLLSTDFIVYSDGNEYSYRIHPNLIAETIKLTPDTDAGKYNVTYSETAITNWVQDALAPETYLAPVMEKTFVYPDGSSFVSEHGRNGHRIADTDQLISDIFAAIKSGEATTIAPPFEIIPYETLSEQVSGEKWIDLNLTTRRVTLYHGDTFIKQFVVNVGAPATPTVTGSFRIQSKYRVKTMKGGCKVITPECTIPYYEIDNIHWTSFFYGAYAFHEAWWFSRAQINGRGTSHGCVNMTYADSKFIYDWAPVGTRVISHY